MTLSRWCFRRLLPPVALARCSAHAQGLTPPALVRTLSGPPRTPALCFFPRLAVSARPGSSHPLDPLRVAVMPSRPRPSLSSAITSSFTQHHRSSKRDDVHPRAPYPGEGDDEALPSSAPDDSSAENTAYNCSRGTTRALGEVTRSTRPCWAGSDWDKSRARRVMFVREIDFNDDSQSYFALHTIALFGLGFSRFLAVMGVAAFMRT